MTQTKEERNEYKRNYRQTHKEHIKEYFKKWRFNHKEEIKKRMKQYNYEHKDEQRITHSIYRRENREKVKCYQRKFFSELRSKYINLLGRKCADCGLVSEYDCVYDLHHINPNDKEYERESLTKNFLVKIQAGKIQLLCSNCHRKYHYLKQKEVKKEQLR